MIMKVYKILGLRYCTPNTQSTPVMLLRLYYAAPETVLLMILQNIRPPVLYSVRPNTQTHAT